jgi:hypothetical protein
VIPEVVGNGTLRGGAAMGKQTEERLTGEPWSPTSMGTMASGSGAPQAAFTAAVTGS